MKVFVVLALALACVSVASGEKVIEGRVTNGHEAEFGQFPYQVGLSLFNDYGTFWCAGSLIGSKWVLTAAHCTDGVVAATVYLGTTIRTVAEVVYSVDRSSIYQHTDFDNYNFHNDISLIKIPAVTFTENIQPIELPAISKSYPSYTGSIATTSGWGKTYDSGFIGWMLNYANLPVISNGECIQKFGSLISDAFICVATPRGSSPCNGDNGGPLELHSKLIGVSSFVSSSGCQVGYPAVFTRVTTYLDWIKTHTGISY